MAIKVRLFLDGKQVNPSELTIFNVTVNRTVNDIIAKMEKAEGGKKETSTQVA